jgi:hypothetical protein
MWIWAAMAARFNIIWDLFDERASPIWILAIFSNTNLIVTNI